MNEPDPQSTRQLARRYTQWLRRRYRPAFDIHRRPPLMAGIALVLRAAPDRPSYATDCVIQQAMADWCRHPQYVRNVIDRRCRVDLEGRPVTPVTLEQWRVTKEAVEKGEISCAAPRRPSSERRYVPRHARGGASGGAELVKTASNSPGGASHEAA